MIMIFIAIIIIQLYLLPSVDGEQFDVEDEGGAAGDAWLGTDGTAREKSNLFRLFRVVTEEGEAKICRSPSRRGCRFPVGRPPICSA